MRGAGPALGLALASLLGLNAAAGCGPERGADGVRRVTMEGEIIDPQCYYTHGGRGLAHRSCALFCARGGQDLAFLNRVRDQVIPVIAGRHGQNPNDSLYRWVGYPVIVHGALFGKRGGRALRVDRVQSAGGSGGAPPPGDSVGTDPARPVG